MAKMKLADAVGRVNTRYSANLTYQRLYMAGIAGRVPVERDETGSRWVVDETAIPAIAKAFGLIPTKSNAKPAAKASTAKRPRTSRSRAA